MPISSGASRWSEDYNYRNTTERESPRRSATKYEYSGHSTQNRDLLDHLPTWNDYISPYSLPLPRVHTLEHKKKKKRRKPKRKKAIAAENNPGDESDPVSGTKETVIPSSKIQKRPTTASNQNDELKHPTETKLTTRPKPGKRPATIPTKPGETKNPGATKKPKQQRDQDVEKNQDQNNDTKCFGEQDKEEIKSSTFQENNNRSNSNQSPQFYDCVPLSEPRKDLDNDHVEKRSDKEVKDAVDKQCQQSRLEKKCGDERTKSTGGNNNELQNNVERKYRFKNNEVAPSNNRIENKVNGSGYVAQQTETPNDTATCKIYNESKNDEIDRANGNCSDNEENVMSPGKRPKEPQLVHKNFTKNEMNNQHEKEKETNANVEETKQKDSDFQDTNDDGKSSEKPKDIRRQKKKNWNNIKNVVKATSRRKNLNGVKTPSKVGNLKENHEAGADFTQNNLDGQCDSRNKNTDIKDKGLTQPLKQSKPDPKSDKSHTTVDIKDDPEKKQVNNLPCNQLCREYLYCDCSFLLSKAFSKLFFECKLPQNRSH